MITKEYTDRRGIKRLSYIPDEFTPADEGLPASVVLDSLILSSGNSEDFLKRLYNELWAVGLVTPEDYSKPNAHERLQAAIAAARRFDMFDILQVVKEQKEGKKNDKS